MKLTWQVHLTALSGALMRASARQVGVSPAPANASDAVGVGPRGALSRRPLSVEPRMHCLRVPTTANRRRRASWGRGSTSGSRDGALLWSVHDGEFARAQRLI